VKLNYMLGKTFMDTVHRILSLKAMPLTRKVPKGLSWPYDVQRFCGSKSQKVIFDVGANRGQTALFLSPYFSRAKIYAFEPVKETYQKLVFAVRGQPRILTFNQALGNCEGSKEIHLYGNDEMCSLGKGDPKECTGTETVSVSTLDRFVLNVGIENIEVLKIDVEGYERSVLEGARSLLTEGRIHFIFCEIGFVPGARHSYFPEIAEFLYGFGFGLCGFYEFLNYGNMKQHVLFCNALFMNTSFKQRPSAS